MPTCELVNLSTQKVALWSGNVHEAAPHFWYERGLASADLHARTDLHHGPISVACKATIPILKPSHSTLNPQALSLWLHSPTPKAPSPDFLVVAFSLSSAVVLAILSSYFPP